jgi:hypothetical protein
LKDKLNSIDVAGTTVTADTMIVMWPSLSQDGYPIHAKATPIYVRAGDLCNGDLTQLPSIMEKIDNSQAMEIKLLRKDMSWDMTGKIRLTDKKTGKSSNISYAPEVEAGVPAVDMDAFRQTLGPDGSVVWRGGSGTLSYGPTGAPKPAVTSKPRSGGVLSWLFNRQNEPRQ